MVANLELGDGAADRFDLTREIDTERPPSGPPKSGDEALRFGVKGNQVGMTNLVLAPHLLDHELGIGQQFDLFSVARRRDRQRLEQAGVLRDVVRGAPTSSTWRTSGGP